MRVSALLPPLVHHNACIQADDLARNICYSIMGAAVISSIFLSLPPLRYYFMDAGHVLHKHWISVG